MAKPFDPASIDPNIFRAYDIRGIFGQTLSEACAEKIGQAIASEACARHISTLAVGYDGRLSGPALNDALIRGIITAGINVVSIGMVPTPGLYFATVLLGTGSGIMITGSHNPTDYNGFKIMLGGETLADEAIQQLHRRIVSDDLHSDPVPGHIRQQDVQPDYIARIAEQRTLDTQNTPLKVVIDCGNGVAGPWVLALTKHLGCEVIPLFCDVDGNFPNHHPDPEHAENLQDLIRTVKETGADIGLAFDGDGDRLGVVDNHGHIRNTDELLCLFALEVLQQHPGSEVVHDVKCSLNLRRLIENNGGKATMWRCGHSMIKGRMKQTGAAFGGEFTGHLFFAEDWYGFDDALYTAVRVLEMLIRAKNNQQDAAALFDAPLAGYPACIATPMIHISSTEDTKFKIISQLQQLDFNDARVSTIDGLRVEFSDGWFGIRASNTSPNLTLRAEADTAEALQRIYTTIYSHLTQLAPELQVPQEWLKTGTNQETDHAFN